MAKTAEQSAKTNDARRFIYVTLRLAEIKAEMKRLLEEKKVLAEAIKKARAK